MNDNMSSTALVPLADTMQLGKVLAESGFFQDSRSASQAVVKVLAGRELGIGAVASMTGINIISGRVALSANLIAALVKRSGRYNYRVLELTDEVCRIKFFEQGQEVGVSTFTRADAEKAGTKNMDKFPRNMLFARAMSNGVKWFCADISAGPIYTPEELGANINEDGDVIDVQPRIIQPEPAKTNGHAAPPTDEPPPFAEEFEQLPSAQQERAAQQAQADTFVPTCPVCNSEMWDNREGKQNPKAPDFKCKDKECPGDGGRNKPFAIWLPESHAKGTAAMWANVQAVYGDTADDFKAWVKERYHVASSKDLTLAQLADIIARLKLQQPA